MRTVSTAKDIEAGPKKRIMDLPRCIYDTSGEKELPNAEINTPKLGDDFL